MNDLLDTNGYIANSQATYNVQNSLREYNEKKQRQRKMRVIEAATEVEKREAADLEINDADLDQSDPLYTNRIIKIPVGITKDPTGPIGLRQFTDPVTNSKQSGRQIYEKVRLINISSKDRQRWISEEIPIDPVTNRYTRLDGNGQIVLYTADSLNAEYYWNAVECLNNVTRSCLSAGCNPICQVQTENLNSIAEPFYTKNCRIFMKVPKFPNPNNYIIRFDSPFSYIKEISLIAAEIPNPYKTINLHNNKIIFHLKDRVTGKAVPFRKNYRGVPFFLIELTPGIYSLERLLSEIENKANYMIDEYSCLDSSNLQFKVTHDCITDIVKIELKEKQKDKGKGNGVLFHWRFWTHCQIPEELTLYRMLGFGKAYLKDRDGYDYYSTIFSSEWLHSSCCKSNADSYFSQRNYNPRPFSRVNLFPETFFYLIIDNLDLGNDAIYTCNQNVTINNVFAKIQIIPLCCNNSNNCSTNNSNNCNTNNNNNCVNRCNNNINNNYLYNTQISSNKIYLESPLRILDRMEIRFVDAFGDLIDFGRLDHSLTFRIVQYIDYLVDTNFDSTRGI